MNWQTSIAKLLTKLNLNEISHSMLFWATKRSKYVAELYVPLGPVGNNHVHRLDPHLIAPFTSSKAAL